MIRMIAALVAAGTLVAGCEPGMMGGMGASTAPAASEPVVASNVSVMGEGASVSGSAEMGASM